MADQKSEPKAAQKAAEPAPPPPPTPPGPLGDAGASANPAVHDLLAHRAIAVSNGDKDAIDAVDAQLADLGVSAG